MRVYTGPKFRLQEDLCISVSFTRLACWRQKLGKINIQAATLPAVQYALYKHTSICLFIHLLADIWVRSPYPHPWAIVGYEEYTS